MKVGDLVNYKMKLPRINGRGVNWDRMPDSRGVGFVVSYNGYGKFEVLWSSQTSPTSHDLYELVPYESR